MEIHIEVSLDKVIYGWGLHEILQEKKARVERKSMQKVGICRTA